MAVDTAHHVITHIHADYADKKDNMCVPAFLDKLLPRLKDLGVPVHEILADTAYSSGENYALLERKNIVGYIPAHGTYKDGPDGFNYVEDEDYYVCPNGKKATFNRLYMQEGNLKKGYATRRSDCKDCPLRGSCINKLHEKRFTVTFYRDHYQRAIERVTSRYGQWMKRKRDSTVEPVFGTLINYLGMRKVNTIGIHQAHKQMVMAAVAYNLKKYLKFDKKKAQTKELSIIGTFNSFFLALFGLLMHLIIGFRRSVILSG